MRLYPFQSEAIRRCLRLWKAGKKHVLVASPTGSGKGTMATSLMADCAKRGQRVLFLVHRREIVEDIASRVRAAHPPGCGIIMRGFPSSPEMRVQIASVQSLIGTKSHRFDVVVADEAHHYRADEWQAMLNRTRANLIVGFTATPQRSDGKALGDIFEELVVAAKYSDMLALNSLDESQGIVPCRTLIPAAPLHGELAMDAAEAYVQHGEGRSAFLFTHSIASAQDACMRLTESGVSAAVVHAKTSSADRSDSMRGLRDGEVKVLVNVGTMVEGVDVPRVSCVVLGQVCGHWSAYIQRVGRCLRPFPGKRQALVLDLTGAAVRHGLPTNDYEYQLTGTGRISNECVELKTRLRGARGGASKQKMHVSGCGLVEASEESVYAAGGAKAIRPDEWDWTMTIKQLAELHGLKYSTVHTIGVRHGYIHKCKKFRDWQSIFRNHAGKTAHEIALLTGATTVTVSQAAKRYGADVILVQRGQRHDAGSYVEYEHLLGKESDVAIAMKYGTTRNNVIKARLRRGIPPGKFPRQRRMAVSP